jgi:hypothetical protein
MKRKGSALCMAGALVLSACGPADAPEADAEAAPKTASPAAEPAATAAPIAPSTPAEPAGPVAEPAAEGAPGFAVVYPGGVVEADPVTASAAGASGGLVTYVTDADPDAVIAFHRREAERAGLASVMAMNQGEARAYGAARDQNNLQVVASPTPEGRTSVQLSWSASG